MIRRLLLTSVSALAFGGTALAADLPSARYAPVAPIVPVFTWTGFYIGGNAGVVFGDDNNDALFIPPGAFGPGTGGVFVTNANRNNDAGFTGGGQIGYNYQAGAWVFGVEADLQYADLNSNNNAFGFGVAVPGLGGGFLANNNNGIEWFGTVRGRVGYAWDRSLLYFTGGFAYGGGGSNNNFCGVGVFGCGNNSDTVGGWVVGGGFEYAFTNNWTAKLEGLWVSLDGNRNNILGFTAAGAPVFVPVGFANNTNNDNEFGVVRLGINYKF